MNEPLLILDIRGLLIRAYNTPTDPTTIPDSNGIDIVSWEGGLRSFLRRDLMPLFDTFSPRRMIAVWDAGNAHRLALFPDYKKSRRGEEKEKVMAEQFKSLFNTARSLLAHLGVKQVKVPTEEADDVIALLCQRLRGRPKTVWTVDSDLLQLVDQETSVRLSSDMYTFGSSYKGYPVSLNRVMRSILGDSSDEYPGVYGIGGGKFKCLIDVYGEDGMAQLEKAVADNDPAPVEAAYQATQDKVLGVLLERWDQWRNSYELANLHPEICYGGRGKGEVISPKWALRLPDRERVEAILTKLNQSFLMPELSRFFPTETLITADNYQDLEPALAAAAKAGAVSYDFESYDTLKNPAYQQASEGSYVDVLNQSITGISFNYGDNFQHTVYVSFNHADTNNLGKEWAFYVLQYLDQIPVRVVQNAAFERTVAKQDLNHEIATPYDTQIMASYVDENMPSSLKPMSKGLFNYEQVTYAEVTGGKSMNELTAEHVAHYGCDDSLITSFLFDFFSIVMQLEQTWEFYRENETEHVHDESDNFILGTRIDTVSLQRMAEEDQEELQAADKDVRRTLEEHAMHKDQGTQTLNAMALVAIEWEMKQHDFDDPEGEEAIEAKTKIWEKAWSRCVYTPYSKQEELPGFKPTAKGLNEVLTAMGLELQVEKVSARAMSAWMEEHQEVLQEHAEFLQLLGPAVSHFAASKRTGKAYEKFERFCVQKLADAGGMVQTSSGDELNFGSPQQMQALLYGMLALPVRRRSKKKPGSKRDKLGLPGAAATGVKPIASALVYDVTDQEDWRYDVLSKYKTISRVLQNQSLYYKPYPLWVSPADGLIHPQIKNCGTVTRRPSGTSPNVLQVSKKNEAKIRKCYTVYQEDYAYVCIDFDGQELRLTASESRDPVMVDSYIGETRKDIHSLTGASLAPILLPRADRGFLHVKGRAMPYEDFMRGRRSEQHATLFKDVRNQAKTVNFLIIYVGGPSSLAESLIIPIELAKEMMQATFSLYKRLQPWQSEVVEEARTYGYVTTAYGNRRHLSSDLYSQDDFLRTRQERQAVNMKAQGCAADILKIVQTEFRRRRMMDRYKVRSRKPIYDEIAACVPVAAVPDYIAEMREIMELTPPGHIVPMAVSAKLGLESWGGAIELDDVEPATIVKFLEEQKQNAA